MIGKELADSPAAVLNWHRDVVTLACETEDLCDLLERYPILELNNWRKEHGSDLDGFHRKHPDAAAACTALKNNPAILSPAPPPTDQACTQQYGGSQKATVTGIVDGRAVEASFSKADGCEIAAWDAAKDVLASNGGAG